MSYEAKKVLFGINHSVLFFCTSIYLGTGWSLIFFSFPVASELTPDNYYIQFVPQVTAATHFFAYMTMVMIAAAIVMIIAEWKSYLRWFPVGVLLGTVLSGAFTVYFIIPYNDQMSEGITDAVVLHEVLDRWMELSVIRMGLWVMQWLCMMAYFFVKYLDSSLYSKKDIYIPGNEKVAQ